MSKTVWAVGLATILLVTIWAGFFNGSSTSQQPVSTVDATRQVEMTLAARETTLSDATGISPGNEQVVAIKDLNPFDWQNCDLTLNDEYKAHSDSIDTPIDLSAGTTTYDSMVFTERSFYKADGTAFDPTSQRPLKIIVACKQPQLGAWVGSFNP